MAARSFIVDLDEKIKNDAVELLAKPSPGEQLLRDSGYIRGLRAARALYLEVQNNNKKDDDEK